MSDSLISVFRSFADSFPRSFGPRLHPCGGYGLLSRKSAARMHFQGTGGQLRRSLCRESGTVSAATPPPGGGKPIRTAARSSGAHSRPVRGSDTTDPARASDSDVRVLSGSPVSSPVVPPLRRTAGMFRVVGTIHRPAAGSPSVRHSLPSCCTNSVRVGKANSRPASPKDSRIAMFISDIAFRISPCFSM